MKNPRDKKTDGMKMETGKPSFKESNDMWPQPEGNSTKGKQDKSIFSSDKLGSGFTPSSTFAKGKGKGATVDKGTFKSKENSISPTSDY